MSDINLIVEKSFDDFSLEVFHDMAKNELFMKRSDAGSCNPVVKMSFYGKSGIKGGDVWSGCRSHELKGKDNDEWMIGDFEIDASEGDLVADGLRAIERYIEVRNNFME